jgi:hypothetical protein
VTKRLLSGLLLAGVLAGCGNTGGFTKMNETRTNLTSNNYRVIMTSVAGADDGFRVFGIGTRAKFSAALAQIREQAQIKDRSRALINITEDDDWFNTLIVAGETLTVTADVIEFTGPPGGGS